jgi:dihydrofolate reductase
VNFDCILAADLNNGIGKNNSLPWRLPSDMKFFKERTTMSRDSVRNAVIMGRRTWESIPGKFKPLPERLNIVMSRAAGLAQKALLAEGYDENEVVAVGTLKEALAYAEACGAANAFVIGGAEVYAQAFEDARCRYIYVTRVQAAYDCDVTVTIPAHFTEVEVLGVATDKGVEMRFERLSRRF